MITATLLLVGLALGQAPSDDKAIQGTWKIAALIEDGKSLSAREIASDYAADSVLVVAGNSVSMQPPGGGDRRKLVFTLDTRANPRAIDLAGGVKVSSRGIYTLSGDSLVLCIGTAGETERPTEFTASRGSKHILLALQRVTGEAAKPVKDVKAPPPISGAEKIRKGLVGTWGHTTDSSKHFVTFNADGSFSSTTEQTRGLRRLFDSTTRSSGTWRVTDSIVVVTITSSTDSNRRGQVYSYRVTHLGDADLIAVDQMGATRREWRVR
jgi:uncharacterized protein (TIGR03067 family)